MRQFCRCVHNPIPIHIQNLNMRTVFSVPFLFSMSLNSNEIQTRSQFVRVALIGSSRRLRGAAPNSRVVCNHTSQSLPFTYVRQYVTDREQDRDRVFDRNAIYFKLLPCASCQHLYIIVFMSFYVVCVFHQFVMHFYLFLFHSLCSTLSRSLMINPIFAQEYV